VKLKGLAETKCCDLGYDLNTPFEVNIDGQCAELGSLPLFKLEISKEMDCEIFTSYTSRFFSIIR
jgi:hypothetical protein